MKKLPIILLPILLSASFSQAQTTVTFQPSGVLGKDATIQSEPNNDDTNFGTSDHIEAAAWTYSGNSGVVRSFLEFEELATLPADATILNARLSLYAMDQPAWQHSTLSGSNDGWLERVTSSWDESTLTWNNQPASTTQNRVPLVASTSATQNYLNIDVTDLVQDMIDLPSASHGFILKLNTESYYRRLGFASSDHSDFNLHPKLVVQYTTTAGTNNFEETSILSCFPNPSSDMVVVRVSENFIGEYFELMDQLGRKVKSGALYSLKTPLDIQDLNSGVYTLIVAGKTLKLQVK